MFIIGLDLCCACKAFLIIDKYISAPFCGFLSPKYVNPNPKATRLVSIAVAAIPSIFPCLCHLSASLANTSLRCSLFKVAARFHEL